MPRKDFDVVIIGNAGVDTNIFLYSDVIDFSVEANFSNNIDYVGQAGGFTSRGFAQLGWRTAYIGALGEDHNGLFVRSEFQKDGIDTSGIFLDTAGTARSINLMYANGQRKNFYDGKSHMTILPDIDTCRSLIQRAKLVHFNIPNWSRYLLDCAQESGAIISCDIQDIVSTSDPYRQDFIKYADILFFSAVNTPDPVSIIRQFLIKKPAQISICGMGEKGCALGSNHGIFRYDPPILELPIVDTNGAGDGLAVGFLSSYVLEGYDLETSILRGQIAARFTCGQKASSTDLISKEILDEYSGFILMNRNN
jgi:sugar/nucleoside kinase (ribokinase family)